MSKHDILLCAGTACQSSNSVEIRKALVHAAVEQEVADDIRFVETGCMGPCEQGPMIRIMPEDTLYVKVRPEDAKEIIQEHLVNGRVLQRLLWMKEKPSASDLPFFAHQRKNVLGNCGLIDPNRIDDFIDRGGYASLKQVLAEMTPLEVIDVVKRSGLRGRGGAGFPTGKKWEFVSESQGEVKYIVCNAEEGDPGAFMDRAVLEGDPHTVIEGMAIAAYAVGAQEGYVYVRAEYPLAIERLETALEQARDRRILGKGVLDTDFSFDIELRMGAGAFVCGEETALIASIEGRRGEPRPRPPFPAQSGFWQRPTLINNVETFANVRLIIKDGAKKFGSVGTKASKGTKVFALAGQVSNTGLVEVPMGITLRELIFDIGGGVLSGKCFKAVQIGGPLGGCLPAGLLDLSIDYESVREHGAIMVSGGVIVLDESSCMVDVARYFLNFTAEESCGKCTPCRIGIPRMLAILTRITEGNGTPNDLSRLHELAELVHSSSLCGLGQTAPNPVLSTLRYFEDEYRAHINDKICPSGVCGALALTYVIDSDKCRACDLCRKACPTEAIQGTPGDLPYTIDESACIRCGTCLETCQFDAVRTISPGGRK